MTSTKCSNCSSRASATLECKSSSSFYGKPTPPKSQSVRVSRNSATSRTSIDLTSDEVPSHPPTLAGSFQNGRERENIAKTPVTRRSVTAISSDSSSGGKVQYISPARKAPSRRTSLQLSPSPEAKDNDYSIDINLPVETVYFGNYGAKCSNVKITPDGFTLGKVSGYVTEGKPPRYNMTLPWSEIKRVLSAATGLKMIILVDIHKESYSQLDEHLHFNSTPFQFSIDDLGNIISVVKRALIDVFLFVDHRRRYIVFETTEAVNEAVKHLIAKKKSSKPNEAQFHNNSMYALDVFLRHVKDDNKRVIRKDPCNLEDEIKDPFHKLKAERPTKVLEVVDLDDTNGNSVEVESRVKDTNNLLFSYPLGAEIGTPVNRFDPDCLFEGDFLTDNIINFYLR